MPTNFELQVRSSPDVFDSAHEAAVVIVGLTNPEDGAVSCTDFQFIPYSSARTQRKQEEETELAKDDATVEISMTEVITLASSSKALESSSPESQSKTISAAKPSTILSGAEDEDSEVNSELGEQERNLDRKGKGNRIQAFAQRDLVAFTFAGDRVVQDFAEQKRREIQEDAPHEVDTTLPGWAPRKHHASRRSAIRRRPSSWLQTCHPYTNLQGAV
ncbi:hypothetical protein SCP_0507840 [Sparassis crispa]|uniref:Uncharacterized protein n=1 Tax=Sparassis crispa TaxID=139825 RepID=A0A401GND2_9APHY|nr:hypothetical protein SCP_0507840 [Sparassis crispa]GBE83728.1 hypothetical protein SCP_0507840 [Sparassis crispa]